jgi:hypothetical protein
MNRALEACQRGAAWILARCAPDGTLHGASDLSAYYKTPAALQWSGHPHEARQVLATARERFLHEEGDLDGTGVPWFAQYRIYPHAWLACAAAEGDAPRVQDQLVRFLVTQWNPESGGFRAREDGSEEIMTTSMAGLACLRAGESAVADGVVNWLRRVMEEQPDITTALYHVWRSDEGLVRGDGSVAYLIDTAKPRQWYFQYGISAAFLAEYARVTGRSSALALAQQYLRAAAHCAADVFRTPQSGKIGWGAAWTYRLTKDPADADMVDAVVDGLCALQCGDGSWNAEGVYEATPTSSEAARFDVTAEFVALLAQMGAMTRV